MSRAAHCSRDSETPIYIEVPFQGRSMLVPADVAEQPCSGIWNARGCAMKSLHLASQVCNGGNTRALVGRDYGEPKMARSVRHNAQSIFRKPYLSNFQACLSLQNVHSANCWIEFLNKFKIQLKNLVYLKNAATRVF